MASLQVFLLMIMKIPISIYTRIRAVVVYIRIVYFRISYIVIVYTRYIYENKIKYTNTYTRLKNCRIFIGQLAIVHF